MIKGWKILVVISMIVGLMGCNAPSTKKPTREESVVYSPFTGMKLSGEHHPVIMAMINNHKRARPQTGLDRADVVVEILAEGEITRFAAFYHDHQEGVIGPVRSMRSYYLELARGTKAVSVHAGGAKDALAKIKTDHDPSLDGIHAENAYFFRSSERKAPHNLYVDFARLQEAIKLKGYEALSSSAKYTFSSSPATNQGKPAQKIHLVYHRLYEAGYQYDVATQKYIRYTQGEKQIDHDTKQPLSMENVIVIYAPHRILSKAGHRAVDITGSGQGFLCQRGKSIPIQWQYRDGLIVPFANGKEVPLLPGKTWVNVLPTNGKVTFQ